MADNQKKGGGSKKHGRTFRNGKRQRNRFPRKVSGRRHHFTAPELPRSMFPGVPAKAAMIFALSRA